ncbi:MAG: type IV secretion system protein, partial [Janthinobacterium lividum]
MIGGCPLPSSDTLARDALNSVDCLIGGQIESSYAALLTPGGTFSTALTVGLTIYVAIIGYRLILGQAGLTLGELVPHFVKIGLILALVTNWPAYQALVFDVLFHGPEQLADVITGQAVGAGHGGILEAVQTLFDRLTDYAGNAWTQHAAAAAPVAQPVVAPASVAPGGAAPSFVPSGSSLTSPSFALGAPQFVAALLWLTAGIMLAASVGVLLVVRIILALLLLFGPVFVAFALFVPTRGLFEGWLRTAVKFALVPLFTLPLTAVMVVLAGPLAAELGEAPIFTIRDSPVLPVALIVFVFAAVIVQAARLGGGIAGGIRLPRGGVAAAAATRLPTTSSLQTIVVRSRAEDIAQAITGSSRRITVGQGGIAP